MKNILARIEHKWYCIRRKKRLKNTNPTILANNCVGGIMYHDLGLRFASPTVNIGIRPTEYVKFLNDLKTYLEQPLVQIENSEYGFPQGMCGDVRVILAHMESYEAAKKKWDERKSRVNFDNLFVVMTDQMGCTQEDMEMFDALPYKNKVLITHLPHPEISCAYYLKGYEDREEFPTLSDFRPGFFKRRYMDDFDYVRFLNGEGVKK